VTYLTFLMDSASGQVIEGSASATPSPRRPEDTFQWKVTCDARGEVAIRRYAQFGPPELIGTATWDGSALGRFRQHEQHLPSDAKWIAIATAIGRELEKLPDGPAAPSLIEKVTRREGRQLYPRSTDWAAMGPRYDAKGTDLYWMRRVKWVTLVVALLLVAVIGGVTWFRLSNRRSPPPAPPPFLLERP
jgi:hypothetical protein